MGVEVNPADCPFAPTHYRGKPIKPAKPVRKAPLGSMSAEEFAARKDEFSFAKLLESTHAKPNTLPTSLILRGYGWK